MKEVKKKHEEMVWLIYKTLLHSKRKEIGILKILNANSLKGKLSCGYMPINDPIEVLAYLDLITYDRIQTLL